MSKSKKCAQCMCCSCAGKIDWEKRWSYGRQIERGNNKRKGSGSWMSVWRSKIVLALSLSLWITISLSLSFPFFPSQLIVDSQFHFLRHCRLKWYTHTHIYMYAHRFPATTHFIRLSLCLFTYNFSFVDFRRHHTHSYFSCRHFAISMDRHTHHMLHMVFTHVWIWMYVGVCVCAST